MIARLQMLAAFGAVIAGFELAAGTPDAAPFALLLACHLADELMRAAVNLVRRSRT